MSMPLFLASSKFASSGPPWVGQIHAMSSSLPGAGAGLGIGVGAGAIEATTGADDFGALAAAAAGAGVTGVTDDDATGFTTTPDSFTGGTTRSTWPTSITFGLSRLFQRARS